jgi:hypothetical protein
MALVLTLAFLAWVRSQRVPAHSWARKALPVVAQAKRSVQAAVVQASVQQTIFSWWQESARDSSVER